jgi:phosphoglycerate dehydrogenase-like enzyme
MKNAGRMRLSDGTGKLHLHFENTRALDRVFDMSAALVKAALKRHPDVARRLTFTIGYDGDILTKTVRCAHGVIGWNFDRNKVVELGKQLRWIQLIGAGVEKFLPLDWLPPHMILTNNSGVHAERASEYNMMAILALNNRVPEMIWHQRNARWHQVFNSAIRGKTLLVLGVGHVGAATAQRAKQFGLHVIGVRRSGKPRRYVDEMHLPKDIRKLIPRADFVLMAAPLTGDSRHLLGKDEIALIKPGGGLVNYSRAGLVDYDALRKRLVKGEISAVLDVFDPEPLPSSSPLWKTPNLLITPHCSSDDAVTYVPLTLDLVFENARRLLAGKRLLNLVSRQHGY